MELILNSPSGGHPAVYSWPLICADGRDDTAEIFETIRFVCDENPSMERAVDSYILKDIDLRSLESMRGMCNRYNRMLEDCRRNKPFGNCVKTRASVELLRHVIQQCYNRAVVDSDRLNQYEPFSPEVYGETSFDLVDQIIRTINFTEEDRFVDLGSGVGQVVVQIAGATPCQTCYGIERADYPALCAERMSEEFEHWMSFYGKDYSPYELQKGDFLFEEVTEKINSATVIFVNNFAFGPQTDHQLKLRFANMKEGAKIISSKAFCPLNFHITERNLSDIGAIMTVSELATQSGAVSWTGKPVTYYIHTIDRTNLERYFLKLRNPQLHVCDEPTVRKDRNGRIVKPLIEDTQLSDVTDLPKVRKSCKKLKSNKNNFACSRKKKRIASHNKRLKQSERENDYEVIGSKNRVMQKDVTKSCGKGGRKRRLSAQLSVLLPHTKNFKSDDRCVILSAAAVHDILPQQQQQQQHTRKRIVVRSGADMPPADLRTIEHQSSVLAADNIVTADLQKSSLNVEWPEAPAPVVSAVDSALLTECDDADALWRSIFLSLLLQDIQGDVFTQGFMKSVQMYLNKGYDRWKDEILRQLTRRHCECIDILEDQMSELKITAEDEQKGHNESTVLSAMIEELRQIRRDRLKLEVRAAKLGIQLQLMSSDWKPSHSVDQNTDTTTATAITSATATAATNSRRTTIQTPAPEIARCTSEQQTDISFADHYTDVDNSTFSTTSSSSPKLLDRCVIMGDQSHLDVSDIPLENSISTADLSGSGSDASTVKELDMAHLSVNSNGQMDALLKVDTASEDYMRSSSPSPPILSPPVFLPVSVLMSAVSPDDAAPTIGAWKEGAHEVTSDYADGDETSGVYLPASATDAITVAEEAPNIAVHSPFAYQYTFSPISPYTPRPNSAISPHLAEQQDNVSGERFSFVQSVTANWNAEVTFASSSSSSSSYSTTTTTIQSSVCTSLVSISSVQQSEKYCQPPTASVSVVSVATCGGGGSRPAAAAAGWNQSLNRVSSMHSSVTSQTDDNCRFADELSAINNYADCLKAVEIPESLRQLVAKQQLPNFSLTKHQLMDRNGSNCYTIQPVVASSASPSIQTVSFELTNRLQFDNRQTSAEALLNQLKERVPKSSASSSVIERHDRQLILGHTATSMNLYSGGANVSSKDNRSTFLPSEPSFFHCQQQNVSTTSTLPLHHLDSCGGNSPTFESMQAPINWQHSPLSVDTADSCMQQYGRRRSDNTEISERILPVPKSDSRSGRHVVPSVAEPVCSSDSRSNSCDSGFGLDSDSGTSGCSSGSAPLLLLLTSSSSSSSFHLPSSSESQYMTGVGSSQQSVPSGVLNSVLGFRQQQQQPPVVGELSSVFSTSASSYVSNNVHRGYFLHAADGRPVSEGNSFSSAASNSSLPYYGQTAVTTVSNVSWRLQNSSSTMIHSTAAGPAAVANRARTSVGEQRGNWWQSSFQNTTARQNIAIPRQVTSDNSKLRYAEKQLLQQTGSRTCGFDVAVSNDVNLRILANVAGGGKHQIQAFQSSPLRQRLSSSAILTNAVAAPVDKLNYVIDSGLSNHAVRGYAKPSAAQNGKCSITSLGQGAATTAVPSSFNFQNAQTLARLQGNIGNQVISDGPRRFPCPNEPDTNGFSFDNRDRMKIASDTSSRQQFLYRAGPAVTIPAGDSSRPRMQLVRYPPGGGGYCVGGRVNSMGSFGS